MAQSILKSLIILQYDWDDVLWKLEGEVWVSYKVKDKPSHHGKIQSLQLGSNGLPKLISTEGFHVEWVAKDCLKVSYVPCNFTTLFIPATKVYSGIHKKAISSLSVSPKGFSVSACKGNELLVWDFNQGELKSVLTGHVGEVYRCKFFPSGEVVMSCGADMQLKIWCAHTGKCPVTLRGHTMVVTDFDFIDRGKNVLSVGKDGKAKLWCCASSSCLADVASLSSPINCCHIVSAPASLDLGKPDTPPSVEECNTTDKIALLGCEDGSVHIIAVHSRKQLQSFSLASAVNTIASLNETHFLVGCQSGQIFQYNLRDMSKEENVWHETNSAVLCVVAFKGEGLISSHADGNVIYRHVKVDDKRVILTGPNCDPVYQLCTDNQFVYTCCRDALIRRYNVERLISNFINK